MVRLNGDGSLTFTVIDDGDGKAQPWHFVLRRGSDKAVKIGRADYCDVRLDQKSVTSLHAEIRLKELPPGKRPSGTGSGLYLVIKDVGSTNGTALQRPDDEAAPNAMKKHVEEVLQDGCS